MSLAELEATVVKEFVPEDEIARANLELLGLRKKFSMEAHIKKFKKLASITKIRLRMAYIYIFSSLPASYKQEFHKKYPAGYPPEGTALPYVFEFARTLTVASQWQSYGHKRYEVNNNLDRAEGKTPTIFGFCEGQKDRVL